MVPRPISRLGLGVALLLAVSVQWQCVLADSSPEFDVDIEDDAPAVSSRNPRLFPLFKLYSNFPVPANTKCEHEGKAGHCLKRSQCKSVNGGTITSSSCASGIGICCIINLKYEGDMPGRIRVKHSPSHIISSGKANLAVYEVPRQPDVCQLRLDFKDFTLAQPVADMSPDAGTCNVDAFTVSGAQNIDKFTLCGDAIGQHLYLHYGESELIKLTLDIGRMASTYDIQVTMIKCSSLERAPEDCAQYFTHARGMVKSFNFPMQQTNMHMQHLNNQRYSVCVKGDSTSITWTECSGVTDAFFITGTNTSASATECRTDYLTIPGFVEGPTAPVFCGGKFPKIEVTAKPYTMYVNFDGGEPELGPIQQDGCPTGFECLTGDLLPCTTNGNFQCTGACQCTYPITEPHAPGPVLDVNNIGFCLQYMKS